MNDRDTYLIKRRNAGIRLKHIAEYIGCHISLLSKYERSSANMVQEKVMLYRQYIDDKNR